jgi:hypothetical protein
MPLFLLRDGSIRRFTVVPDGLSTCSHRDRHGRIIHVLLDAPSEHRLLQAQQRRLQRCSAERGGRVSMASRAA